MSAILEQSLPSRRSLPIWFLPVQGAALITTFAIASGGQVLRAWFLAALAWLLALPLLVSLEAGLIAMILFEPFRGVLRRGQYIFLEYSSQDPIHVITPIVTIFAAISLLKSRGLAVARATPLAPWVSILALIYFFEIFNPLQGGLVVGFSGAMFALIPLLWFFFGQYVTADFISKVLRLMVILGLLTSLYGIYQLVFGYPAFEQYWISNTEFYTSIAVGNVERAIATFSSAEEWARYIEFAAIAAFGFSIGQKRLQIRVGWLLVGLTLVGFVALTGQRAAAFGLVAGLIALLILTAKSLSRGLLRASIVVLPFVLLTVLVKPPDAEDIWSNDETQTVTTVLSHTQRGMLAPADEESFRERIKNWTFLLTEVIPFRPVGAGIGAGSLSEWRFNKGPGEAMPIDSSILLNGITCGIAAMLLFAWTLARATWLSLRNVRRVQNDDPTLRTKRIITAIMFALVLNSIFGLTFTLYSIAPLVWLFMGWISAENQKTRDNDGREVITI